MKKTRRRYDREFKISVVAELESGKPPAQIAREHGIYPSHPSRVVYLIELTDYLWPKLLARDELITSDRLPISAPRRTMSIAAVFISNNSL